MQAKVNMFGEIVESESIWGDFGYKKESESFDAPGSRTKGATHKFVNLEVRQNTSLQKESHESL